MNRLVFRSIEPGTPYTAWLKQQQNLADWYLRKFLRVRKNLYKDVKQFDSDRILSRCEKCHGAFWGDDKRCKKHKIWGSGTKVKYNFYYDKFGNKIPS